MLTVSVTGSDGRVSPCTRLVPSLGLDPGQLQGLCDEGGFSSSELAQLTLAPVLPHPPPRFLPPSFPSGPGAGLYLSFNSWEYRSLLHVGTGYCPELGKLKPGEQHDVPGVPETLGSSDLSRLLKTAPKRIKLLSPILWKLLSSWGSGLGLGHPWS